jgi:hypothetical protein
MRKNIFNWMLLTMLSLGLGMGVVSCKDDDDDDKQPSGQTADDDPLATEEAQVAWRWVSALTDAQSLTPDWSSKTFEPTIGVASTNNENTRIILVSDLDEAKQHFSDLADVDVNQLSAEYNVNKGGVGKMTWTPSKEGAANIAVVDVDTKLIPHLQRIVYCRQDQMGQNGLFSDNVKGTAYYRFGDVIRDDDGYYWVCVRPSFAPNKGDSHWMNVFNDASGSHIPPANLQKKWNGNWGENHPTIILPTELKYKREHIYNLSNLFWAMLNPEAYSQALLTSGTTKGLGGFEYNLNGKKFIQTVSDFWTEQYNSNYALSKMTLWEWVFGLPRADLQRTTDVIFYYKGYSWGLFAGAEATLWRYSTQKYLPKIQGSESGDKIGYNMNEGFDARHLSGDPDADKNAQPYRHYFTKDNGAYDGTIYYLVRYKTGEQLSTEGKYSPYENIKGCTDIFVFNKATNYGCGQDHPQQKEEDIKPNGGDNYMALKEPRVGCLIAKNGKFYMNMEACQRNETEPVAMVTYLGGDKRVEKGKKWNGLAISITDATEYNAKSFVTSDSRLSYCSTATQKMNVDSLKCILDGWATTESMTGGCSLHHVHEGVDIAYEYPKKVARLITGTDFSNWFLPSVGQWILTAEGLGWQKQSNVSYAMGEKTFDYYITPTNVDRSYPYTIPSAPFMTTTESDFTKYYVVDVDDEKGTMIIKTEPKSSRNYIRPFIAFTYGKGGSIDPKPLGHEILRQPALPGKVMTEDGAYYNTAADARAEGKMPFALVAYVAPQGETVETGKQFDGLAIGLFDKLGTWCSKEAMDDANHPTTHEKRYFVTCQPERPKLAAVLDGIQQTESLKQFAESVKQDRNYPYTNGDPQLIVVSLCNEYSTAYNLSALNNVSGWFVPSAGQWVKAFQGLGAKWSDSGNFENNADAIATVNAAFDAVGLSSNKLMNLNAGNYYSTTQYDYISVWTVGLQGMSINPLYEKNEQLGRCFLAFKVTQ